MTSNDERVQRYAEAMYAADVARHPSDHYGFALEQWDDEARAVMAVADAEQAEVRGTLDVLQHELDAATADAEAAEAKVAQMMRAECKGCGVAIHLADDAECSLRAVLVTRPCSGANTNVCVAEGCFAESCIRGGGA